MDFIAVAALWASAGRGGGGRGKEKDLGLLVAAPSLEGSKASLG